MSTTNDRQLCFVVMPFSKTVSHGEEYWRRHFDEFLKPLIEETPNVEAQRSKPLRGDILRKIITDLATAPIVVADLTDKNANVYWELGVRQSFKHGTVTIAEAGTELPFDIGAKGTLFYYPSDYVKNEDFRHTFKEAVSDCIAHPDRPDSHVLESMSGRGSLYEIFQRDEAIRRLKAVMNELDRNTKGAKELFDQVKFNQSNPTRREVITDYYSVAALELLLTTRYIDEDDYFYKLVDDCWNHYQALNENITIWQTEANSDSIERWFLAAESIVLDDTKKSRRIESVMMNLRKRM